jgi:glycosyltransferase involved in cell wall biosynthesis
MVYYPRDVLEVFISEGIVRQQERFNGYDYKEMNVLFVVPYVPNLVRTRPYNLIRHLSRRGNRVTVLTVWEHERERVDLEELKRECHHVQALPMPIWRSLWNCVWAMPRGAPLQSVFSWHPDLIGYVNRKTKFDVAHVEHLRGSRYGLALKKQTGLPVVWDSVDCITHLFRQAAVKAKSLFGRWRTRLELARTERFEGWLLDKFDHVLVTSQVDKQALVSMNANGASLTPISVLENGVDLSYFSPDRNVARKPSTLVVSGKMSYHANAAMAISLVENIMPFIWARRPEVRLWIVGKDPGREIRELAENPAVTVTGYVDDLRSYLRRATVAVAPVTYGAGVQNKVLEAMACATPVVSTPSAVSALSVAHERELLIAEDPHEFASAVLHLFDYPDEQHRLGQAGLSYVKSNHEWSNIAAKLEEIYRRVGHPNPIACTSGVTKEPHGLTRDIN